MSKEELSWGKTLGVAGIVGMLSVAGGAMFNPEGVDNKAIEKSVEDAVKAEMALSVGKIDSAIDKMSNVEVIDPNEKVLSAAEKILENDMWESTAEVLALDELEDRDYKDLKRWMVSAVGFGGVNDSLNGTDYKDIDEFKVVIKDVEVLDDTFDVDDKDAKVERELKIYFEDNSGDRVKKYITAIVTIKDGDVEDLKFSLTE